MAYFKSREYFEDVLRVNNANTCLKHVVVRRGTEEQVFRCVAELQDLINKVSANLNRDQHIFEMADSTKMWWCTCGISGGDQRSYNDHRKEVGW